MQTIALVLLCLLAVWWGFLVVKTIFVHFDRVRLARTMTPAEVGDYKRGLKEIYPYPITAQKPNRFVDCVMMSPLIFVLLPCFLYAWIIKDPLEKRLDA